MFPDSGPEAATTHIADASSPEGHRVQRLPSGHARLADSDPRPFVAAYSPESRFEQNAK
jgi:hypothetical protein